MLQHDPSDPLLLMGDWLTEAGATVDVRRLFAGEELPADLTGYDALISLGGEMGAYDDDVAPWLPATKAMLAAAVAQRTPTLAICLGSQLLAVATGGAVTRGEDGPEIGAYLTAKRDAAEADPLFDALPMTPDVMHYHYDVVSSLPPGAVLLLSSTGYPNQAWRIGPAAWALQFHIEPSADDLRAWGRTEGREAVGRLGPVLDQAEDAMGTVWRDFVARFVRFAAQPADEPHLLGHRLPIHGS
ncbi:GMP synthase-Glutamine amidotransferase [Nakamurella panacisegetis]|uniref:GMP synthase-Glutamine amidotransferase n=1 Tax=Nakamurella panacisegetis TaxID=1090615 RepID=A0A1H0R5A1_9ACTN|nr:GMP synthase-Glutamine amidotransferase [Nakamurella panacisegetis]